MLLGILESKLIQKVLKSAQPLETKIDSKRAFFKAKE